MGTFSTRSSLYRHGAGPTVGAWAWLLLAGATWRFIRADDPSVQVSYPAPGLLASWVPEAGR